MPLIFVVSGPLPLHAARQRTSTLQHLHSLALITAVPTLLRRVDCAELRRVLEDSELCRPPPDDVDVDQLFTTYDTVLCDVADHLVPLHSVRRRRGCLSPWFDAECRARLSLTGASVSANMQSGGPPAVG